MATLRPDNALSRWFNRKGWSDIMIGLPYLWLVVLFLLPFLIVVAMSVATKTPTAPPFSIGGDAAWVNLDSFRRLVTDDLYVRAFLTSLGNAFVAMVLCLLLGFPMALGLTRVSSGWRNVLLMLVILPFWTSFLLRVYAWMGLIGKKQLVQPATDRGLEFCRTGGLGGEFRSDDEQ